MKRLNYISNFNSDTSEQHIIQWTGVRVSFLGGIRVTPFFCDLLERHSQNNGTVRRPNVKDATEKQIKTSMYWSNPDELYNGGKPLKITLRDERGIMVTILAG